MRVAIVHDWLLTYRGGERVLEALLELYPQADLFTLFHRPGAAGPVVGRHRVTTSFLDRLPGAHRFYKQLLPLMPLAVERFDLSGYELVISSSHCVAKGVLVPPDARHVSYCHTPMRYAWDRYRDYFGAHPMEPFLHPFLHYLRMWDVTSSARVDQFIANSKWVAGRIRKYYRRGADVLPPFVDLTAFRATKAPPRRDGHYLFVGAAAPYKRADLAVRACRELDRELVVIGDSRRLAAKAGPRTRFVSQVTPAELLDLYSGARALLYPGEEDFGIVPLEAMACGRPVIALGRGGATETVVAGVTGRLFSDQSEEALVEAILDFERVESGFDPAVCRRRAEVFSRDNFLRGWRRLMDGNDSAPAPSPRPGAREYDERPVHPL